MSRLLALACLAGAASGFMHPATLWIRSVSTFGTPAADAYSAAEAATKKFGITSTEARLAWEEVEDIENKGGAVKGLAASLADECDVLTDELKCKEFEAKMARLAELTNAAKVVNLQLKRELIAVQSLKMGDTAAAARAISGGPYKAAKAAAEAASAKFGKDSREAKVAWEAVFEIVSSADDDKVSMGSLEDECLVSSSSKCVEYNLAMDALQSAIISSDAAGYNKSRL
jgi:hypothetical protein